ncbi:hypothetical protein QAD02_005583 [Eretmocerus hayati]|uniref:Uncharacterized protein n=1 Tax=Eretmocerus hayati TaxID=131215 RepID=A0ACC2NUM6_9HYME|nr:hypothetical protein QAD02_005583 [Eretmocerus hayati]
MDARYYSQFGASCHFQEFYQNHLEILNFWRDLEYNYVLKLLNYYYYLSVGLVALVQVLAARRLKGSREAKRRRSIWQCAHVVVVIGRATAFGDESATLDQLAETARVCFFWLGCVVADDEDPGWLLVMAIDDDSPDQLVELEAALGTQ